MADSKKRKPQEPPMADDEVDEASEESFPASDSPSWTPPGRAAEDRPPAERRQR